MADPTPQQRIEADLRTAMKAGEKERVGTLRMLLADLNNERIRRGGEVDEEAFLGLVQRGVKQRRESSEQFRAGNRPELADREEREAAILGAYLPAAVSEDEVRAAVRDLVAAEGLAGGKAMGRVMGALVPRFKGRIDGRELQRIAREELGG